MGGLGLNFSKSDSQAGQSIWGPQASGLTDLYGSAGNFFNAPNPYIDNALSSGEQAIGAMSPYTNQAMPAWSNLLQGGQFGGYNPNVSGANQMATGQGPGFNTYQNLMNPQGNPYLDQMFNRGAGNMVQQWGNNIMPQISGNAEMGGGLGGSRQGIAEGLATQGLMDSMGDYGVNLYGGQYQSDQNRALAAAGGYNTDMLRGIDTNRMIGQGTDQTGLNALGQGPNAMNLGFSAPNQWSQLYGMQSMPYNQYSSILGNPVPLSWSRGESESYGFSNQPVNYNNSQG